MTFTFEFSGSVDLHADEIWPDKDGPREPTVADVLALLKDVGMREVLYDWCLFPYLSLSVNGEPALR